LVQDVRGRRKAKTGKQGKGKKVKRLLLINKKLTFLMAEPQRSGRKDEKKLNYYSCFVADFTSLGTRLGRILDFTQGRFAYCRGLYFLQANGLYRPDRDDPLRKASVWGEAPRAGRMGNPQTRRGNPGGETKARLKLRKETRFYRAQTGSI